MSRAQIYARNTSQLLDNLSRSGRLSLATMQARLPAVVEVAYQHTGQRLKVGAEATSKATGTLVTGWPACTRVEVSGTGLIAATLTFYYRGYGERTVRATGNGVISLPVPLPDGWSYPDVAGRLTNMSRQGEIG